MNLLVGAIHSTLLSAFQDPRCRGFLSKTQSLRKCGVCPLKETSLFGDEQSYQRVSPNFRLNSSRFNVLPRARFFRARTNAIFCALVMATSLNGPADCTRFKASYSFRGISTRSL